MFKIIDTNTTAKKTQTCSADGYELAKGEPVLLAVEREAGGKPKWHVFCPTDANCVGVAESLAASSKPDKSDKTSKPTSKKNDKKNNFQFGDEQLVTAGAVKEALATLQRIIQDQNATISGLNNRIEYLEKWQKQLSQKSDSKSNPQRTPVDADEDGNYNVPAVCLGTKSDGTECKQTRINEQGYCHQHKAQSGVAEDKTEDSKQPEPITSGSELLVM
jgi:hypothetical protein